MKTALLSMLRQAFGLAHLAHLQKDKSLDELLAEHESRRRFLKTAGQAGLLLGIGGPVMAEHFLENLGKPAPKIAIVGAGIGGLSAGYFLRRKRVQAVLFEGDKRPGGRIKSARIFDDGNLNTEIGAEFIDSNHSEMLFFARMLGLDTKIMDVEQDTFGQRDALFFENRHWSIREVLEEFKAVYPRIRADQKRLNGRGAARLDNISMGAYIDNLPVSSWVKKMLHAAYLGENGLETSEQSAANMLGVFEIRDEKILPYGISDERFKIIGGNEQITQGLAKMLETQIRYEHKLHSIRENANRSLTLSFNQNGTTYEETFDAVIVTLPFAVLRDLDIKMDLPPHKRRVISELGYGTNTKFIVETQERIWRKAGYRGFLFNEQIPNGWDSAQMQQDNQGVGAFTCFFGGDRGKAAARGTEQEQLAYILPALDGAFPGTAASLTGKLELANWSANPFAKGSYSCFKVGQHTAFEGAAFEPVRQLYFAGEHCSTESWGFMNGAAETGRKAAEKILKKMGVR